MLLADDLNLLLDILPTYISDAIKNQENSDQLVEIVLDMGRRPEARFVKNTKYLSYQTIVWQDLDYILKRLGKFSGDNRAGIEKTLHRISALRNRQGIVIGLTCRIGRAVFGTVNIIRDLLEQKKSLLLLGKPGVGKTTAIREIARVLSDSMKKRVIIIDTSNEIAGDGDLPHPSIGKARRMQVSNYQNQHEVMIEAVENHMPEIIIIDEIGTELEATAARTIAERGIQLIGTAHGISLENVIKNPTITDLVGGIQYVTLGDEEAKRRSSSKSILERKAPPTFEIAIEIHAPNEWIIHENIAQSVDLFLEDKNIFLQKRLQSFTGKNNINCSLFSTSKTLNENIDPFNLIKIKEKTLGNSLKNESKKRAKKLTKVNKVNLKSSNEEIKFLYVYGINVDDVVSMISALQLPIILTKELQQADYIMALAHLMKNNKKLKQLSQSKNIPIQTIQSNSLPIIAKALRFLIKKDQNFILTLKQKNKYSKNIIKNFINPLEEARIAIEEIIIPNRVAINLSPQSSYIRYQQSQIASHYQLKAMVIKSPTSPFVRILPN